VTKPSPNDDLPTSPPQTPETIAKIVGYALSELSSDNAHHEFEHLCRHIARRRICSNILPATGPVSGGGDAGADFESLPVRMESSSSRYWQMTSVGKVLFACSLNRNLKKKVAADVAAAAQYPEPADTLYFFYNRPVKIADRNKLKAAALETLVIFRPRLSCALNSVYHYHDPNHLSLWEEQCEHPYDGEDWLGACAPIQKTLSSRRLSWWSSSARSLCRILCTGQYYPAHPGHPPSAHCRGNESFSVLS
jgi:hypothetical protein